MTNSRMPLIIATALSLLIALTSYRFLILGLPLSFPEMLAHLEERRIAFTLHVALGPLAMAIGAVQFYQGVRKRKALHRWLGRIYAVAILISGSAGLVVAMNAAGGLSAQIGFSILSVLWVVVTANAVRHAMAGRIGKHRRWMVYSFALTFAGVTLRLWILPFAVMGFSYTEASVYLVWLAWLPNLAIAWWWLNRKNPSQAQR